MLSLQRANALGATSSTGRSASPIRRRRRPEGNLEASADDSLFRRKKSLFDQKEFPVFGGTGNAPQAIESVWRRHPNPLKEIGIGRSFQGFPVNFRVLRECVPLPHESHDDSADGSRRGSSAAAPGRLPAPAGPWPRGCTAEGQALLKQIARRKSPRCSPPRGLDRI